MMPTRATSTVRTIYLVSSTKSFAELELALILAVALEAVADYILAGSSGAIIELGSIAAP